MGSIYCTELVATLAFTLALLALTSSEAVGQTTSATSFELGEGFFLFILLNSQFSHLAMVIRLSIIDIKRKFLDTVGATIPFTFLEPFM